MENQKNASRGGQVRRSVLAGLAVLVIAFCAWSMSMYVRGRDPLTWLPGASEDAPTLDAAAEQPSDAPADEAADPQEQAALTVDDVKDVLGELSWAGEDLSLEADDATVALTEDGIWVELRGALPADEAVRLAALRLAALMQWAEGTGVEVPQVTWIEEDLAGTVRLTACLHDPVPDGAAAYEVLGACDGYAISGDAYAELGEKRPDQALGTAPVLPDGSAVPVEEERTSRGESLSSEQVSEGQRDDSLVQDGTSTPAASATQEGSAEQGAPSKPASITVHVTVDASAAGAGTSSASVTLAPGSTAFDALEATGVSIGTRSFGGGAWVTSIGGVAEDSGHGWTYTVDGSMPSSMSDRCEVYDGSSVVWTYVATN